MIFTKIKKKCYLGQSQEEILYIYTFVYICNFSKINVLFFKYENKAMKIVDYYLKFLKLTLDREKEKKLP